jgi:hypothetical protein
VLLHEDDFVGNVHSIQDAGVLGSTGLPAEQAASASKARPVHPDQPHSA